MQLGGASVLLRVTGTRSCSRWRGCIGEQQSSRRQPCGEGGNAPVACLHLFTLLVLSGVLGILDIKAIGQSRPVLPSIQMFYP